MRRAAQALLAILFVICAYRAFTQSLVHDEALTNELYVLGPLNNVFHSYTANHHFLNSILMRISAAIFGDSEWALRLPALAGASLFTVWHELHSAKEFSLFSPSRCFRLTRLF